MADLITSVAVTFGIPTLVNAVKILLIITINNENFDYALKYNCRPRLVR